MPNTAAVVGTATPNKIVYLLTGDGTAAGPTITNATLLTDMVPGPLEDLFSATYADQAAMRLALFASDCEFSIHLITTGVDVTAEINQVVVDTDVDAVTATQPELNIGMSDTTGQIAYLTIRQDHTITR